MNNEEEPLVQPIGSKAQRTKTRYKALFLRGRRTGSYIEILEIIEAEDAEEAVRLALDIAEKAKWHLEKVERMKE